MSILQKTVAKFLSIDSKKPTLASQSSLQSTSPLQSTLHNDSNNLIINEPFKLNKTIRYGFPYEPVSFDYDPCQHLLAIGNKYGLIKIYGNDTIETCLYHTTQVPILFISFVINEGALITYSDDMLLSLWSLRQKQPAISFSRKIINEKITSMYLPFQNKWLYIGTERGNVYILNFYNNFSQSGYEIKWNNLIDLSQKTHPGKIVHLSEHPLDNSKLLIGFDTGLIVLWNIKIKKADLRFYSFISTNTDTTATQLSLQLSSISWLYDGKYFMSSHSDGYLLTWSTKCDSKPPNIQRPHFDKTDLIPDYSTINKIVQINESMFIFSGGIPTQSSDTIDALTIIRNKNKTIIEMTQKIIDFYVINSSPWMCDEPPDSYALIILLENSFEIVDLKTEGFPKYDNYHNSINLNDSNSLSIIEYIIDPDWKLLKDLLLLKSNEINTNNDVHTQYASNSYPIKGGIKSAKSAIFPYYELLFTCYDDGCIRVWDASGICLDLICKLKTYKLFDKKRSDLTNTLNSQNPFKITCICVKSIYIAVSGIGSYVILYKFNFKKQDQSDDGLAELAKLEIPISNDASTTSTTTINQQQQQHNTDKSTSDSALTPSSITSTNSSSESSNGSNSSRRNELKNPYKLRIGTKKQLGYQPELVALLLWSNKQPQINSIDINVNLSLLTIGTTDNFICIDIHSKLVLLNIPLNDLRIQNDIKLKSPKKTIKNINKDESMFSDDNLSSSENSTIMAGLFARQFTFDNSNIPKETASIHSDSSVFEEMPKPTGITFIGLNDQSNNSSNNNNGNGSSNVWCGTSEGSVYLFSILNTNISVITEDDLDFGSSAPNLVIKLTNIRHTFKGSIIFIGFMDVNENCLAVNNTSGQQYAADDSKIMNKVHKKLISTRSAKFESSQLPCAQQQYVIICAEHEIKIISLPSHNCLSKHQNDDDSFIKANLVKINNLSFLICYLSSGLLQVFCLPSLKLNSSIYVLNSNKDKDDLDRVAKSIVISEKGHLLYMCSPSEIQKIFLSTQGVQNLNEILPELFDPKIITPNAPKPNLFKSLFSNAPMDRELLFGESSGRPSVSIIKSLDNEVQKTNKEMTELQKAAMLRGEKLSELDQRAEQLNMAAAEHARLASELSKKYKKKSQWFS